jgi:hypothetical protein
MGWTELEFRATIREHKKTGCKIFFSNLINDFVFKTKGLNFFKSNFELDSNKMK